MPLVTSAGDQRQTRMRGKDGRFGSGGSGILSTAGLGQGNFAWKRKLREGWWRARALAPNPPASPLAPDWSQRAQESSALESALPGRLAPRSAQPHDGLVLRTVSARARCEDRTLARLAPVAEFIVDAELARTNVTDEIARTVVFGHEGAAARSGTRRAWQMERFGFGALAQLLL